MRCVASLFRRISTFHLYSSVGFTSRHSLHRFSRMPALAKPADIPHSPNALSTFPRLIICISHHFVCPQFVFSLSLFLFWLIFYGFDYILTTFPYALSEADSTYLLQFAAPFAFALCAVFAQFPLSSQRRSCLSSAWLAFVRSSGFALFSPTHFRSTHTAMHLIIRLSQRSPPPLYLV